MDVQIFKKESFSIIGKEGSTEDGEGFIQNLWAEANAHYTEIDTLMIKDEAGIPVSLWGAMSDFSMSFTPWEKGFSEGLYLAGAEVDDEAMAPDGWEKWTLPTFTYLRVKVISGEPDLFTKMLDYIKENGYALAGAVQEQFCPAENGQKYLLFPVT